MMIFGADWRKESYIFAPKNMRYDRYHVVPAVDGNDGTGNTGEE
jgi:hypothetical protein